MFTDMVGYTLLSQKNEALAMQLLDEHRKLIRPFFLKHNGREVKTMGDAFLVEFVSALEATRCAFDIQQSLHELNSSRPQERRVLLRIGIHLGDVMHNQNDVYGDAVNIASRIEPLASPEGICVTGQVYDQIKNKFEFPLSTLGKKELKNVGEPIEVFRMILPWEKESESKSSPDRSRIAVLPFTNISPDPADEYFADGMTEELISTMSKIGGLKVIARTSVMSYKGGQKKIDEIAKELEVGTVLEGSVRKAGDRLRITVQLIDSQTSDHLWAESYDRELKDVFAIQSDVASRVADSLSIGFFSRAQKVDTDDVEAYTLYLRAIQLYHEGTESNLKEAIALFERAVLKDPRFVRAYAGLAHTWGRMVGSGYEDFTPGIGKAEVAARKALELGPEAEAHAAMADINGYMDRFEQSILEAEKAIRINPNLSEAYVSLGINHSAVGRLDQALTDFLKAYELDPLSSRAGILLFGILWISGREGEALDIFERMKRLNPMNPRIYGELAYYYMLRRDFVKAQELLDTGFQINPSEPWLRIYQGVLYVRTGRTKEVTEVLQRMLEEKSESVRLMGQLFMQTALGNLNEALKALMREAEIHSWYTWIKSDPFFEELRKDPRFLEFCIKVGLPA